MKTLMEGNEALAEAAVRAGCRAYFGYPITPQTQVVEYLAKRMPEVGGICLQAESEVASINMVYGAASAGARVMTTSSSPGISLMAEGFSYLVGSELPALIVNVMRAGPGLGGILPSQADYLQATRGAGHGGYRTLVLAPCSVQECADVMKLGFDKADEYRNPVFILADGLLGQMMEPVELPDVAEPPSVEAKPWATTGTHGRKKPNIINSLNTAPDQLEAHNIHLNEKFAAIARNEVRSEMLGDTEPDILVVAYGSVARIAHSAVDRARAQGLKVGLLRPVTLWPYPSEAVEKAAAKAEVVLVVEMNGGQMIDDVRLSIHDRLPVKFYGRQGGNVPSVREVYEQIIALSTQSKPTGEEAPIHAHA